MNTTPTDEQVLKTDVLGRVKTPLARQEQVLDEFERSGVSGSKFAELIGVKYQTFATWVQKRRRQRGMYKALKAPLIIDIELIGICFFGIGCTVCFAG